MPGLAKGKGANFDTRTNPFLGKTRGPKSAPNFTEVPDIGKALQVLCEAGCACMVGWTRDGGAVVVTILDQDQRHRTYCSTDVELQEAVDMILKMYGD